MNRIGKVIQMNMRDRFNTFYLPWIIIGCSFAVNLLVAATMNEPNGFKTGGILSIIIYMFVMGILAVAQGFPFALGFSIRRTDYVAGTLGTMVIQSILFAIMLTIIAWIETLSHGWGVKLSFFHLPVVSDGGYVQEGFLFFLVMLFMSVGGFVIGCYHKRFGKTGMFSMFIAFIFIVTIGSYLMTHYDVWPAVGRWFEARTVLQVVLWTLPVTVVCGILSHLFLRRATA